MDLPSCLLVFVGGRRSQCPRPSHQGCHKSRVSFRVLLVPIVFLALLMKRCATSSMPTFLFIGTSSYSFIKVLHQFVCVHHVSCRHPSGFSFSHGSLTIPPSDPLYLLFIFIWSWASYTWGCSLTSYSKGPPRRAGRGLINCLRSRHKVFSLNGFSYETWYIGCTLILGGNSNLYMSLSICLTIRMELQF